jgi:hypothetical protein
MAIIVPRLDVRLTDNGGLVFQQAWQSWFQQFTQAPSAAVSLVVGTSPFNYSAKESGQIAVIGGIVSAIALIRGTVNIDVTGEKLILVAIKDIVRVTYTGLPVIQFLPNL